MAITIDVKALVNDAVKNLDVVNDKIDAQDRAVNKLAKAQHDLESSALKLADAQKRLEQNTDPAKQHDLEGAVLSARVALDKQETEVNQLAKSYAGLDDQADQVKSSQGGMIQSLVDVKAAVDLASQAFSAVQQVLGYVQQAFEATVIKAANWGDSMGDLAQLTGDTVENTSRLAATLELVGIDSDKLGRILKSMTKEGLNLNLDTLLDLNKQYNALQSPVERNTFLFKNFGRAAEDMAEVMGRSESELRALMKAADASGKVIGEDFAKNAELLNVQMEILNQKIEGAEIRLGAAATQMASTWAPSIRDAHDDLAKFVFGIAQSGSPLAAFGQYLVNDAAFARQFADAIQGVRTKAVELKDATDDGARSAKAFGDRWQKMGQAFDPFLTKAEEVAQRTQDFQNEMAIALSDPIGNENKRFQEEQGDLTRQAADLKQQIDELNRTNGQYYEYVQGNGMSTAELALATQKLARAQDQLANETDPYKQAQLAVEIEKQQTAISGADTVVGGYVDNSKKVGELTTQYDDVTRAIQENEAAHQKATATIVLDYMMQSLARDGFTTEEMTFLRTVSTEWGLYEGSTLQVMDTVDKSIAEHGLNAVAVIGDVETALGKLPSTKEISINITTHTQAIQQAQAQLGDENYGGWTAPTTPSTTPKPEQVVTPVNGAYATGGTFTVPGSGSGDRPYLVNLTPGERVDVTPVGVSRAGGGPLIGQVFITTQPGQDNEQIARMVSQKLAAEIRSAAASNNW